MTVRSSARARLAQARFRALMAALARPGRPASLEAGWPVPADRAAWAVALADVLLDHEVTFCVGGDGLEAEAQARLSRQIEATTGARPSAPEAVHFVLLFGEAGELLERLPGGDALYPDRGATLLWSVDGIGRGLAATVRGPGVEGEMQIELDGVAERDLARLAEINRGYPLGLDAFFFDCAGSVVALPRSARIEIELGVEPCTRAAVARPGRER